MRVSSTYPGLPEPDMGEFMEKGEGPRCPGVSVVDDNEGRNGVC